MLHLLRYLQMDLKIPEIHLYVRIQDYKGGPHVFSDGSDVSLRLHHYVALPYIAGFPQRLLFWLG